MAGQGNPYAWLTAEHLRLLRGLLEPGDGPRVTDEAAAPLAPLLEAGLVLRSGDRLVPGCFVAATDEVERIDRHAREVGAALAEVVRHGWPSLLAGFGALRLARSSTLAELGFFLIGDRVLDVGLLDALARDSRLMPAASARPGPGRPHDRYYFWLIEGEHDALGRYGQRSDPLPDSWTRWSLLSFGRYTEGERPNLARQRLHAEALALALVEREQVDSPESLEGRLGIPLVSEADAAVWSAVERPCADALVAVYREHEASLRALYGGLRVARQRSDAGPDGFGEFFCWYDHVAYAHAIDALAAAGIFTIPPAGFQAAIWPEVEPGAF
jgi:hypothetical protein